MSSSTPYRSVAIGRIQDSHHHQFLPANVKIQRQTVMPSKTTAMPSFCSAYEHHFYIQLQATTDVNHSKDLQQALDFWRLSFLPLIESLAGFVRARCLFKGNCKFIFETRWTAATYCQQMINICSETWIPHITKNGERVSLIHLSDSFQLSLVGTFHRQVSCTINLPLRTSLESSSSSTTCTPLSIQLKSESTDPLIVLNSDHQSTTTTATLQSSDATTTESLVSHQSSESVEQHSADCDSNYSDLMLLFGARMFNPPHKKTEQSDILFQDAIILQHEPLIVVIHRTNALGWQFSFYHPPSCSYHNQTVQESSFPTIARCLGLLEQFPNGFGMLSEVETRFWCRSILQLITIVKEPSFQVVFYDLNMLQRDTDRHEIEEEEDEEEEQEEEEEDDEEKEEELIDSEDGSEETNQFVPQHSVSTVPPVTEYGDLITNLFSGSVNYNSDDSSIRCIVKRMGWSIANESFVITITEGGGLWIFSFYHPKSASTVVHRITLFVDCFLSLFAGVAMMLFRSLSKLLLVEMLFDSSNRPIHVKQWVLHLLSLFTLANMEEQRAVHLMFMGHRPLSADNGSEELVRKEPKEASSPQNKNGLHIKADSSKIARKTPNLQLYPVPKEQRNGKSISLF